MPADKKVDQRSLKSAIGAGVGRRRPLSARSAVRLWIEFSPEMLARARTKVAEVVLIKGRRRDLSAHGVSPGVLCFYTHDIMLSPTALPRVISFLNPGGRVVAAVESSSGAGGDG